MFVKASLPRGKFLVRQAMRSANESRVALASGVLCLRARAAVGGNDCPRPSRHAFGITTKASVPACFSEIRIYGAHQVIVEWRLTGAGRFSAKSAAVFGGAGDYHGEPRHLLLTEMVSEPTTDLIIAQIDAPAAGTGGRRSFISSPTPGAGA